jgi:hypothetical protein
LWGMSIFTIVLYKDDLVYNRNLFKPIWATIFIWNYDIFTPRFVLYSTSKMTKFWSIHCFTQS